MTILGLQITLGLDHKATDEACAWSKTGNSHTVYSQSSFLSSNLYQQEEPAFAQQVPFCIELPYLCASGQPVRISLTPSFI